MKINKEDWKELINKPRESKPPTPIGDPPVVYNQDPFKGIQFKEQAGSSKVDHPTHYNQGRHEVIDIIEDWSLGFHCGNVVKYVARHNMKGEPKRDIEKAIWYLQRYLETL